MSEPREPPDPAPTAEEAAAAAAPDAAFGQTILRIESDQQARGLDAGASVMPEPEDPAFAPIGPSDSGHIPIETIGRGGRRLDLDESGELADGPAVDSASYEIEQVLGRGGMGVVCLARQRSLNRPVALKIARKAGAGSAGNTRAALAMFVNEAYTSANLDHPNVVPVHTLARDPQGRLFFTMKRVTGLCWEDLLSPAAVRNRAERERISRRAAEMALADHLDILLKVADALAYAHAKGVIHRDVKPENVMIGAYGEVLLMDWGLAMPYGPRNPYALDPERPAQLVGTPAYLAPEMARGEMTRFGPATDVYLLGATLYRVLTGRPPHWGEGIVGAVRKAASGRIEPPQGADAELARICAKALAPRIEHRYPDVKAMQADLRRTLTHAEARTIAANAERMLAELRTRLVSGGGADAPRIRGLDEAAAAVAYGKLGECIGALRQSLDLWPDNREARAGLLAALVLQIELAMAQADLTLAKAHLDLLAEIPGAAGRGAEDSDWRLRLGRVRKRLAAALDRRWAEQAAAQRRARLNRRLSLLVVLLLVSGALGGFTLVMRQKSLAQENLRLSEQQHELTREALLRSERLQLKVLARAVTGRAALLSEYLRGIEQTTALYRQRAVRLLTLPAGRLAPARRTPAGRPGYYLDADYYAARTRPPDMRPVERYGQPMSADHPTVKLAPGARRGPARRRALADVARLARLGGLMAEMHRARHDLLYSVIGTRSGALISYPGSGRFRDKPDYDVTRRPWYRAGIEAESARPRWVDPHVDAGGRGLLITCVSPLIAGGQRRGVVGVEVAMQRLQRLMAAAIHHAGDDARALLVRPDGRVVADTAYSADPSRWRERFAIRHIAQLDPALASYWRGARAGQVPADEALAVEAEGGARLFSHAPLDQPPWLLIVDVARSAILKPNE